MGRVNIRYIVSDVATAIQFYTGLLGFHLDKHPAPGFAQLSKGCLVLLLNRPGAGGVGQAMPNGQSPAPGGWNRFQIEVEDLAAVFAKLSQAGAAFRNEIVVGIGGKQILLEDPSGNPIELFEPARQQAQNAGGTGTAAARTSSRPDQSQAGPQREAMRAAAKRIDRVNDGLHVGGALIPDEYGRLSASGITHVIDLRKESDADIEQLKALGIEQRHVPVPDNGAPSIAQLVNIADFLDEADQDRSIYVHCKGGFGRAATVAVGLLVLRGDILHDAITQMRTARPEIRLNEEQLARLRSVEDHASQAEEE